MSKYDIPTARYETYTSAETCIAGLKDFEYPVVMVVSEDQFTILPMAQDHKRVGDGDKGPNTGGMGSYSPLPQLKKADRQRMIDEIVKPTMNGLVQGIYH